jgi:flagellar basal body rod protein FlgB
VPGLARERFIIILVMEAKTDTPKYRKKEIEDRERQIEKERKKERKKERCTMMTLQLSHG